jgi:hypothetical protein
MDERSAELIGQQIAWKLVLCAIQSDLNAARALARENDGFSTA